MVGNMMSRSFNCSKRSSEGFHSTIVYRISSPITSVNKNRWLCTFRRLGFLRCKMTRTYFVSFVFVSFCT